MIKIIIVMGSIKNLQNLRDEANKLRILSVQATEASKSGYAFSYFLYRINLSVIFCNLDIWGKIFLFNLLLFKFTLHFWKLFFCFICPLIQILEFPQSYLKSIYLSTINFCLSMNIQLRIVGKNTIYLCVNVVWK